MMRQGRVISVGDAVATIRFEVEGACASCSSRSACGNGAPGRELRVSLPAGSATAAGQLVHVEVDDGATLMATAIAYLIPLAGFTLAMLIAAALNAPDGLIALASVCGMTSGFLVSRSLARQAAFQPHPRLVSPCGEPTGCTSSFPEDFR